MAKYLYQIRLRSDEEFNKLLKEYQDANEKNAEACKIYGLGTPNIIGKYPTKLVIARYDLATKQMEEKSMAEISTKTKYDLLMGRSQYRPDANHVQFEATGTLEEREEFRKEMNLNLTPEEVVKILNQAESEKIPKSVVDDALTGFYCYDEANTIAKYNALKQGRTSATVDECAKAAAELIVLRENAFNSKR